MLRHHPEQVNSAMEAEVSRAIIKFMRKEGFYSFFLSHLVRIISSEIETAAVGVRNKKICLLLNPRFFLETLTSIEQRIAILKHEVLHLVFNHLFRSPGQNHHIQNLAADLVVNQYVNPWPLPEGAVLLDSFPCLDLKPEETMEYYYEKLIEAREVSGSKLNELRKRLQNSTSQGNLDGENLEKVKGEYEDWKSVQQLLEGNQSESVLIDDHSQWSSDPMNEISKHQIEDLIIKVKEQMRPEDWNGAPGWLKDYIDEVESRRKPKLDWKRSLRIFASNAKRTRIQGTMKRYSRRFGEPNPGIRIKQFQKIAIIVDTSGSMTSHEVISSLFAEIHGIWKAGAEIHIVECDTMVQQTYDYRGITPKFVLGGGGNDCNPAFEYLWEYRRKNTIDGCLFLTDGWFSKPTIKPPCKLLWILTPGDSCSENLDFGSFIRLNSP